tara:strand:- start:342 stop:821 length:480 start_codon:yes stop_codon:yes gene_type:complete
MPFYAGQQGKLFIDGSGTSAAKVVNWSFRSAQSILDTTSLADTDRTAVYGVRSLSGACRLYYYRDTTGSSVTNDCATLLAKVLKVSEGTAAGDGENAASQSVTLRLFVDDGTASGKFIDIPALISSVAMSMSVGEVLAADITFESNGAPLSGTNIEQVN